MDTFFPAKSLSFQSINSLRYGRAAQARRSEADTPQLQTLFVRVDPDKAEAGKNYPDTCTDFLHVVHELGRRAI